MHNSTYKKLAVHWLNKALCFVSSSVVADSFVLRNRQLLVAAKRYPQPLTAPIEHSANLKRHSSERRQSHLAIPSQNKKRGNSTAQKPLLLLPHILFCPHPPNILREMKDNFDLIQFP